MPDDMPVAAIVHGQDDDVDPVLAAAVATLSRAGSRIGGLLQQAGAPISASKREMLLRVLRPDGGEKDMIRLSDARGPGVQGCVLDVDALARAAMRLRAAIESGPDLLVVSRFGKEEAAGGGLRAELADAVLAGLPLLVPVRVTRLSAWWDFIGAPTRTLRPRHDEIVAWVWSVMR